MTACLDGGTKAVDERVLDEQLWMDKVRAEMSEARYDHVVGVVEMADALARRFGVNVADARCAAWMHDLAREWPLERLTQIAEEIDLPSGFASIPALLHGPVAAHFAARWFGIDNEDVLNAIRYHTTGRPGMSMLEKILYLADGIERGRVYPGVDHIRTLAESDLDQAVAASFDNTLQYLILTHQPIFPLTVMARNELWERLTQAPQAR